MGSKAASGARQAIISQMPPHDLYIETHLGTGAVLRAKPPAARSIAIERDPQTLLDFPPPAGVEVVNGCAHEFLRGFDMACAGRVLVYADPPYVNATRSSTKRYRFDYQDPDHVELLGLLSSLPPNVYVILSGYPSALYSELLPGWRTLEFQVMTRGGPRTECLWMNFEAGRVQWAAHAGANFTERQRIKRKADRWQRNYAKLPAGERLAILSALLEVEAG